MSADDTTSIANCSFCRGEGLPILPVRYAIARTDSKIPAPRAPVVNGPFGEGVTDVATLPDGQDYTLRLMRAGFLYVYNEAAGTWSGYVVTEKGYLYAYVKEIEHSLLVAMDPANPTQGVSNKLKTPSSKVEFSCAANNSAHQYPGRCITIPDAANADNIYLAFSDTAWTNRVWHEHATNEVVEGTTVKRRDQMRKLSLAEWRGGQASHASSISTISQYVAEASIEELTNKQEQDSTDETGLEFSLDPVNGMADDVDNLVSWADSKSVDDVPAVMVALDDPARIASDLSILIKVRNEEFHADPAISRPYKSKAVLSSLQVAIKESAENNYIKKKMDQASRIFDHEPINYGPGPELSEEQVNYYKRLRVDKGFYSKEEEKARKRAAGYITAEKLKKVSDDEWNKHKDMLRDGEPTAWYENEYHLKARSYNDKVMLPLSRAYISWFEGGRLLLNFDCNYDDTSPVSGEDFSLSVASCLLSSQEVPHIFAVYKRWIGSTTITSDNLILRSLCLNSAQMLKVISNSYEEAKDKVDEEEASSAIFIGALPWTPVISSYKAFTEELPNAKAAPTRVLAHLFGPALSSLNESFSSPLMAMLGMIEQKPVIHTKIRGTISQAIDMLVDQLSDLNDQISTVDKDILKRKLEISSRSSSRSMTSMRDGVSDISIYVDRLQIDEIASGSDVSISNKAADSILDLREYDVGREGRIGFLSKFADRESQLGVIGVLLGACGVYSTAQALDSFWGNDADSWRFRASLMGLGSAISELTEVALARSTALASKVSRFFGRFIGLSTRVLGIGAAAIFAICDGSDAINAYRKGDYGMATLYLSSAIIATTAVIALESAAMLAAMTTFAGVTVSAALISTLLLIGGLLGVVAIIIAVTIAWFARTDLQDWFLKSYFGSSGTSDDPYNDDRFNTYEEEMQALKNALEEG